MYVKYAMTDRFEARSFQIGAGISQINVLANLNFDDDYSY